jgi:tRNA pseudouridine38-40 synthase
LSVQGEVEAALSQLGWQGHAILAAGRTDTGVHASGQVIAFDLQWNHPTEDLQDALNACLPADIAVRGVALARPDFHPRYQATARRYAYRLYCQPDRDPLQERYAWRVWPEVQLEAMQAAASLFLGQHDFAAFGSPLRVGGSTIRTVTEASWRSEAGQAIFSVSANAFLYHMVRRMVFALVQVGQGRLGASDIEVALERPDPSQVLGLAPAHGLTLLQVIYPAD